MMDNICPRCGVVSTNMYDYAECLACGFKTFKRDRITIDWQKNGWTIARQMEKILEEVGEVAVALINGDLEEAIRETLDVRQTCDTMLAILSHDWEKKFGERPPMKQFEKEHIEKLERKGYL